MSSKSIKVIFCENCNRFFSRVKNNICPKCKEFNISIAIFSLAKYSDNINVLLDAPYRRVVVDYLDNHIASGKLEVRGLK